MADLSKDKSLQLQVTKSSGLSLKLTSAGRQSIGRALVMSLSPTISYKAAEPTFYPWTIRHDSLCKAIWDWIVLLLVIYTAIEVPYNVAFILPMYTKVQYKTTWEIINLHVDFMFVIDVIINFRTTYVQGRSAKVVSNPKKIARHYLKTWFFADFISAIPFDLFSLISSKVEYSLLSLLKTARLLRLVRVARKLDRYSEYGIAVIFLLMGLFTLTAHWLACIWYAIGRVEKDNHPANWINILSRELSGNKDFANSTDVTLTECYLSAIYFTLSSLTSVGFGNVSANTNAEKIFAVCSMLVGALMFATVFGNLTAIIQRLYSTTSKYHKDLAIVREFINFYEIPQPLSDTLEDYTRNIWAQTKGVNVKKVLEFFPESLQTDVCYHLRQDLFNTIPAFKEADHSCLRSLAMKFRTSYCLPEQCVVRRGDPIQEMYFICSGSVEVVRDGKSILTLGKGDVISCDYKSLSHIPKANSDLIVRTIAEIHSIDYEDLLECLRAYPEFGETFFQRLEVSYSLQEYENVSEGMSARAHRFSNARSELSSFQRFPSSSSIKPQANGSTYIDIQETSFSTKHETQKVTTEQKKGLTKTLSGKKETNNTIGKTVARNENIEDRLSNIESRLIELESTITTNFNVIIAHVEKKKCLQN
ncbi:potassium voltage-gated channel subfamily H member 6-like isoform X2 [Dendronephthya gigantea]|uniref:potassium voltage-gated channel subfamily H member 6-like isoform X2 n=1 Tax=Dendronephthya gigantea TaxID=151771 RepID=UPI00106A0366|nr:potassium voltage-gated channel subfamily H member 6-like isoform X2 [Dendronephthya gigantea]